MAPKTTPRAGGTGSRDKADPAELKRQLEAIAGRQIDLEPQDLIKIFAYPVGAVDYTPPDGNGVVKWQRVIIPIDRCDSATLLDASGFSATGTDGKRTFLLSQAVCLPDARLLAEPINVVATARSDQPFFLTTTHSLVQDDPQNPYSTDVQITVYAWGAGGAPAPNVTFDWRCRAVSNPIIL